MAETHDNNDNKEQATLAGCLLMIVCLGVIFGSALPVVRWRDPATGQPLPREIAIALPVLAGALCFGIGTVILRLVGLPVLVRREKGPPGPTDDVGGPPGDEQPPG
jgi:hypothetical protein